MTDTSSQHNGAPLPDPLYELLPPVFRMADIAQGYPLLALSKVFDHVREQIGDAIVELEDDWFIQTCPTELIPYVAAQLGLEIAEPVRPEHRALVADTLGFRRRKGIAAAIPRRVRDGSGWYALYAPNAATPLASWPLPDAEPGDPSDPSTTPSYGLLRVWRLPSFAMTGVTPIGAGAPRTYRFNPLGLAQPLYNLANTPLDWVAAPPVTALPVRLTTAMLAADLEQYNRVWTIPGTGPANAPLYGPERGLVIRYRQTATSNWTTLGPDGVRAMPLGVAALQPPAPDFPLLQGGTLNPPSITAQTTTLNLNYGDAHAVLTIEVPANPAMSALVTLLQNAITTCVVTPGTQVSEADVHGLIAGSLGNALLIVPATVPSAMLSLLPVNGSQDPLMLSGTAGTGIAAATLPLDATRLALLTDAPPGTTMTFTAPTRQVLNVHLPLAATVVTPQDAEQALAQQLTNCFTCLAGARVVIVAPASSQTPMAPTAPAWQLGLVPAVTIDPDQGVFSWPAAWAAPAALAVDYGIALPGAVGGVGPRAGVPTPTGAVTLYDAGNTGWIVTQLSLWESAPQPFTVLVMQSSATRYINAQVISPPPGDTLWITSAPGSQAVLIVSNPGSFTLTGPTSSGTSGTVGMAAILLRGAIWLNGGNLNLSLSDMTLAPPSGSAILPAPPPAPAPPPPLPPFGGAARIVLERTISAPLDFTRVAGTLALESCALSPLNTPPGTMTTPVLIAPLLDARIVRTTLMGSAQISGGLEALDSLFAGVLTCSANATFANCYVAELHYLSGANATADTALSTALALDPPGFAIARCTHCGKLSGIGARHVMLRYLVLGTPIADYCVCTEPGDVSVTTDAANATAADAQLLQMLSAGTEFLAQPPVFAADNAWPMPGFARLAPFPLNPRAITAGASNRDELGVYNLAVPTARRAELDAALDDALLEGVTLDLRFES